MIDEASVAAYHGASLRRGKGFVYIAPHPYLRPYLANYTLACPRHGNMPRDYTFLPSGSVTLCYGINSKGIYGDLCGINTKASVIGASANQFDLLLLLEFRPAGLWQFLRVPQHELVDRSFQFSDLNAHLNHRILEALMASDTALALVDRLDQILLSHLFASRPHPQLRQGMADILRSGGLLSARQLAQCVLQRAAIAPHLP